MSIKKEIIEKVMVMRNPEGTVDNKDKEKKRFLGRLKRKYRLMIIYVFLLSLIIIFMVLPMVIAVIMQNP
jgi:hypothetical protein